MSQVKPSARHTVYPGIEDTQEIRIDKNEFVELYQLTQQPGFARLQKLILEVVNRFGAPLPSTREQETAYRTFCIAKDICSLVLSEVEERAKLGRHYVEERTEVSNDNS